MDDVEPVRRPLTPPTDLFASPKLLRLASDVKLVALVRSGHEEAFCAIYDRHHRAILSFCQRLLGDAQEAEDALQQVFLSAYRDLRRSQRAISLRAWLFTIARNRCYSVLRSRPAEPAERLDRRPDESIGDTCFDELTFQVELRQELREVIADVGRLPTDQRSALVLAGLGAYSHEQVAQMLGIPRSRVKALIFQARESLSADRDARAADCSDIRRQLATAGGGGLRRRQVNRHLHDCPDCRAYRRTVQRTRHLARAS